MAKGANQKLKLLYLIRIFQEKTDDDHGITMQEIINSLAAYGVTAERKSLYDDFETLGVYGIDINKTQHDRNVYYSIGSREFEVPELKLLVDAVQSSKFITQKKSEELIGKLEKLTSVYEAVKLRRQVYVHGRIKTMNESIYYAVDAIHEAIAGNNQVRFQYFQWNVKKEQELKHNGAYYKVSPWGLSWDDENYYLIGYDSAAGKIKHYFSMTDIPPTILILGNSVIICIDFSAFHTPPGCTVKIHTGTVEINLSTDDSPVSIFIGCKTVVVKINFSTGKSPPAIIIGRQTVIIEINLSSVDLPPSIFIGCKSVVIKIDLSSGQVPPAVFIGT